MVYLDNNGTTFLLDEVRERLQDVLRGPIGNPASTTESGARAAELLSESRHHVAALIDAAPEQILFTSSGSEANVSAVRSAVRSSDRKVIVTSEIEHASLRELWEQLRAEGHSVRTARTRSTGEVDVDDLERLMDEDVALLSLQAVNNETGVIQPFTQACELSHRFGALFHTDAAQAVGKTTFSARECRADFVSLTGHKFHAPAGVGALYARDGWESFVPLVPGGSQEFGVRGGTHNMIGIVGMGEAARLRHNSIGEAIEEMANVRSVFESRVVNSVPFARVNGSADRVCNTANILFDGIDGKALFAQLVDAGIECAQSSACTSQYPEPSEVLRAMGLDYHQAFSSIRFSFSVLNSEEDAQVAAEVVTERAMQIHSVLGGVW